MSALATLVIGVPSALAATTVGVLVGMGQRPGVVPTHEWRVVRRARVLGVSCTAAGTSESRTPYPGSFYSFPLLALLAAVLVVASLAARQVALRPRGLATTEYGDDELRRRSLTVIAAAIGVSFAWTNVGVASIASSALTTTSSCAPSWAHPVGVILAVSGIASALLGCWFVVRVLSNDRLTWT